MNDIVETAFEYYGDENTGLFSTSEKKWIKKVYDLKKKFPNDIYIQIKPEDNFGCMVAILPKSWFKISPPRKMELSDEDRAKRSARALAAREARARKRGA